MKIGVARALLCYTFQSSHECHGNNTQVMHAHRPYDSINSYAIILLNTERLYLMRLNLRPCAVKIILFKTIYNLKFSKSNLGLRICGSPAERHGRNLAPIAWIQAVCAFRWRSIGIKGPSVGRHCLYFRFSAQRRADLLVHKSLICYYAN